MIEPTNDARTISVKPSAMATIAMMSSGALPNVAFRASNPWTRVEGDIVRRLADEPRDWDQRRRGEHEQRQIVNGIEPIQNDDGRPEQ